MPRPHGSIIAFAAALLLLVTAAPPAAAQSTDGSEALAAVDRLFDAMHDADTAAIRQAFLPEAQLVSIGVEENRRVVRTSTVDAFVAAFADPDATLEERMPDPSVRAHNTLASVWGRYTFHVDGRVRHCGTNAIHLVRTEDRWRISGVTYDARMDGCEGGS